MKWIFYEYGAFRACDVSYFEIMKTSPTGNFNLYAEFCGNRTGIKIFSSTTKKSVEMFLENLLIDDKDGT